jgi:hypothetical protein
VKKIADVTDHLGNWLRVDIQPGPDLDTPHLYTITVYDGGIASVHLNDEQALALLDALWEATA